MRIGLDFDNTIARYDRAFLLEAQDQELVTSDFAGGKLEVRSFVRSLPDGERKWMRLQGQVYGKGIEKAEMFEGLEKFLVQCRNNRVELSIVSHKTEFGHMDDSRVNLRDAATTWMENRKFFDKDRFGIRKSDVWFENTRKEKVERIQSLGLVAFVDDLPEVFAEEHFPKSTECILFLPDSSAKDDRYLVKRSWAAITSHFFGSVSASTK